MCYQIQNSADVRTDLVRIAREQVAQAVAEIIAKTNPADKTHNVRRCLKRVRSLLKLMRPMLPAQFYSSQNQHYRDMARKLAPIRDYYVTLQTFDDLKLSRILRRHLSTALAEKNDIKTNAAGLNALKNDLEEALKDVDNWPVPQMGPDELAKALQGVYGRARRAFKQAQKTLRSKKFHQWRQRTKVLEHSLRLVDRFCPKPIRRRAKKTDALSDALGSYHDLYLLAGNLEKLNFLNLATKTALNTLTKKSRKLQNRTLKLGKKIFRDKPSAFGKRYRSILRKQTHA